MHVCCPIGLQWWLCHWSAVMVVPLVCCHGCPIGFPLQEKYSYICPDIAKEFAKYDSQPDKWFKVHESMNSVTKQV